MAFRDFLIQQLLEYDPTIDVGSTRFEQLVLDPVDEYLGEDLPQADPRALVQARLDENDPSLDNSVFADLFGKPAAALAAPAFLEIRSALTRRRLDDERLLSGDDLEDLRDFFLVEATAGGYSRGLVRVFYSSPRSLFFDVTLLITVQGTGGGAQRIFRPEVPQQFSVQDMRQNVSGALYYVDVALIATETGAYYDLAEGEARGASGFSGAVRVVNLRPFAGGVNADTTDTFLARIRNSLVLRSFATPGGAAYVIPSLGIEDFEIVQGGDSRMVRDRIYGPATIAGIPGGFRVPADDVPDGSFIRLGIAHDIWISPSASQQLVSTRIDNVRSIGIETIVGDDGTLTYNGPVLQYNLQVGSSRLIEVVAPDPDVEGLIPSFPAPYPGRLRPLQRGDLMEFEGFYVSTITGERRTLIVTAIAGDGLNVTLADIDPSLTAPPPGLVPGRHYRFLRAHLIRHGDSGLDQQTGFCIPLTNPRAFDSDGVELFAGSNPADTIPGTNRAETIAGSFVPKTTNVIADVTSFPLVSVERLELLDPVTRQPTDDFIYPRQPLFIEFLHSKAGTAALKATLVRFHLLGPQATALHREGEVRSLDDSIRMVAMYWRYASATAVGTGVTTDVIEIVGTTVTPLSATTLTADVIVVPERLPRVGDWVQLQPGVGPSYYFPIRELVGTDQIVVSAPDIPVGTTGVLYIYQGVSRSSMLSEGRGPEGTYSFDVWCRESEQTAGYVPGDPPLVNTQAYLEEDILLSQGFELASPLPGQQFSVQEQVSLVLQGGYAIDGQETQGRSLMIHAFPGDRVNEIQAQLDEGTTRPIVTAGLAKLFPPAFVVVSFFYDAETLEPEDAASAVFTAFESVDAQNRIELSDLIDALYNAGADYVEAGRVFVLRMDHNRTWTSMASRGAIPVAEIGDFVLQAVTVTRLRRRAAGEVLDTSDPYNYAADPYTLRPGGFDAD